MRAGFEGPQYDLDSDSRTVRVRFRLVNLSGEPWSTADVHLGWQLFDPDTGTFIQEGKWVPLPAGLAAAETVDLIVGVDLPPERGFYHVYVSPVGPQGWTYESGESFLLLEAAVEHGRATVSEMRVTTAQALRRKKRRRSMRTLFSYPLSAMWRNRQLIQSMVRRDIMARYRGSFGDVLWTVLNPLMLMATYFFVFGLVLQSRFGADGSRTGWALYFLSAMLPWLPFAEAVGRSPYVIVEHRNFVKKLVFPVEILPVTQVISGLVTQGFAIAIFLVALLLIRGHVPWTALWLPALIVPQVLFTLGLSWFFSALGVFLRDLGQIIGFVLTLWFFLTPICYPEAALGNLPEWAQQVLAFNPFYSLVSNYRAILLEGAHPSFVSLGWLMAGGATVFLLGHAWFSKLRRTFADVI